MSSKPYETELKNARVKSKTAVGIFKALRPLLPGDRPGLVDRELDDRMENPKDKEEYFDDVAEAGQANKRCADEIVEKANAIRDEVRIDLVRIRELATDAQPASSKVEETAVEEGLEESLEIVRALLNTQPGLSLALRESLPVVGRHIVEQREPLLESLEANERRLAILEKEAVRSAKHYQTSIDELTESLKLGAEQRSQEVARHKELERVYSDDRAAWKKQWTALTKEVDERKIEIEQMGDTIDEQGREIAETKAESSAAHTSLESAKEAERVLRAELAAMQQKDGQHAAQISKLNDDLAAMTLRLSDNAENRNLLRARIQELEGGAGEQLDELVNLDNELSNAKQKLEASKAETSELQGKYDEMKKELDRDIDNLNRHNIDLKGKVSRRDERLMRANTVLAEVLVFRTAVLGWHGVNDENTDGLGQELMEVAIIASRLENGPIMSHSLDGLQLTYAGDTQTSYGLHEQMVRFWCQCRAGGVDYVSANDMLNRQLVDAVGWSGVPYLYKAFALLLQRLTQVSGASSLNEIPERHLTLLLRGLLCMATLGNAYPAVVPTNINLPTLLSEVQYRVMAWLYSNPSTLGSALLSAVQRALSAVPTPSAHHDIVLDAVKTREDYLDSSNSDLQAGIALAVDSSRKTILLFVDSPTTAVVQFTKQHVKRLYCENLSFGIELDPTSMKLSDNMQTLRLGKQSNVIQWVTLNLL